MRAVYEFELASLLPEQRIVQHVRATSVADAIERQQRRGGPGPVIGGPIVVRPLAAHEPLEILVMPGDLPKVTQ